MTAEFALLLPVIVGVLFLGVGALSLLGMQLSNTAFAADSVRTLARGGDPSAVVTILHRTKPGALLAVNQGEDSYCVKLSEPVQVPLWSTLIPQLEVHACVPVP